jgi:hypothetical protein
MTTTGFDQAAYKAGQECDWTATAQGWLEQHRVSERQWQQVSARLLDRARVQPGHRVLDMATAADPAVSSSESAIRRWRMPRADRLLHHSLWSALPAS